MTREIPTAISAKYQLAMNMMEMQRTAPRIDNDLDNRTHGRLFCFIASS